MKPLQTLHHDSQTTLAETDYFFLGSGKLSACIQWSRDEKATPLGLILQQPNHFTRKWGSYLFHPEYGLERTMISVIIDGVSYRPSHQDVCVSWTEFEGVANVQATWHAGEHEVIESYSTAPGSDAIVRWICVRGAAGKNVEIEAALYANPIVFSSFGAQPGFLYAAGFTALCLAAKQPATITERFIRVQPERCFENDLEIHLAYAVGASARVELETLWQLEKQYWHNANRIRSTDSESDRIAELLQSAAQGLRAAISENGRFDSGLWQYGMEWGRDASRVAEALVYSGQFELARAVLTNILTNLSNDDGQVAEASRFRGGSNSELDSNGFVLDALKTYIDWTNDREFVESHWTRIAAIADHLLRPEFLDAQTGMLLSARDVWERMEAMGIEPGYDVAHQSICIVGLEGIARLAEMVGHADASKRWAEASSRMRESFLTHPTHAFIEDGRIIKRRTLSGDVQLSLRIDRKKESADYFSKFVPSEMPLASAGEHRLEPDVTQLLPILLGIVDARSDVACETLKQVGSLWSQAWGGGGIGRYDVSGEPDSPGPWSLATILYGQAALRCGDGAAFEKALAWLADRAGAGGAWFEFYGQRPTPPLPPVGILPWSWAEFIILVVRDIIGARVENNALITAPLRKGVSARLRFRNTYVECI